MIRIAIIDSGVHASHPHIGGGVDGFGLWPDGSRDPDYVDRIGHGTAVAAAIREKAPDADLLAIKVFRHELRTDAATLARAITAAAAGGAHVINLSLGTSDARHAALFAPAVAEAQAAGAIVVAAYDDGVTKYLPGSLDGVVAVRVGWECPRDVCRVAVVDGRNVVVASGYPRAIPGVPPERNLKGVSFAVANASGLIARALARSELTDRGSSISPLAILQAFGYTTSTGH